MVVVVVVLVVMVVVVVVVVVVVAVVVVVVVVVVVAVHLQRGSTIQDHYANCNHNLNGHLCSVLRRTPR